MVMRTSQRFRAPEILFNFVGAFLLLWLVSGPIYIAWEMQKPGRFIGDPPRLTVRIVPGLNLERDLRPYLLQTGTYGSGDIDAIMAAADELLSSEPITKARFKDLLGKQGFPAPRANAIASEVGPS